MKITAGDDVRYSLSCIDDDEWSWHVEIVPSDPYAPSIRVNDGCELTRKEAKEGIRQTILNIGGDPVTAIYLLL